MLTAGCTEKAPPPATSTELRVPLPEGWAAKGSSERLLAGPPGRSVVSFESKLEPRPPLEPTLGPTRRQGEVDMRGREVRELVQGEGGLVAEHPVPIAPEPEGDQLLARCGRELDESEDAPRSVLKSTRPYVVGK